MQSRTNEGPGSRPSVSGEEIKWLPLRASWSQSFPSVPHEIMSLLLHSAVTAAHACNIPIKEEAVCKGYMVP